MRRNHVLASIFSAALLVLAGVSAAEAQCTLHYQLANGQIADATQVMADFNALLTCLNNVPAGSTNAIQYNAGAGNFGGVGPMTNGQLAIGSTGNPPQAATLSAGPGITIANGSGSITIASNGGSSPITLVDNSNQTTYVSNSSAETTIYSVSIPAGALTSSGRCRAHFIGTTLKNAPGAPENPTLRVKYGGTTMVTLNVGHASVDSATQEEVIIDVDLVNLAASNAQFALARAVRNTNPSAAGAAGVATGNGTAAVDSTASQTFAITWQFLNASSNITFTSKHGTIECM